MSGLECSEILLSQVYIDNGSFRYDSEYFDTNNIIVENKLLSMNYTKIDIKHIASGPFGSTLKSSEYLMSDGIPFIRIENIRDGFFINKNGMVFISEKNNNKISNSELLEGDIIISKVGNTIGCFAKVDKSLKKVNISENNIGIKLREMKEYEKDYILTFFNSYYGQVVVLRRISGNAQPKLNVSDISDIPIPIFSKIFMKEISKLISLAYNSKEISIQKYNNSENLLLKNLGLLDYKENEDNVSIKSLSESFIRSGRLDSEYYQPKYDEIIGKIKKNKYKRLGDIVEIKKSIEPGSNAYQDEGIPFIRVADLTKYEITMPEIYLDRIKFEKEELKPKKDTILLTKDGSCGIAYKVDEDMDIITSGAILHLKINDSEILPDYLTLVLNSITTKMQVERDAGGSVIQHWKPSEIEEVLIPILPIDIQEEIDKDIIDSYRLRKESKDLLEKAKRAVEIAIEEGEEQAIRYLGK
ncbi:hypothetical protein ACR77J_13810 [Tissierella praeacuta]|uniref:hypothetical protein n=1 Tax=Tissierella praeacuta TaxID=43131 RepID=UPI003DA2E5F2